MTKEHHKNKERLIKIMANKEQNVVETKAKPTKVAKVQNSDEDVKNVYVRGILGLVLLTVFGSIAFMTVVIWSGTDNVLYKYATAPAALFDVFIAFVAFSKILK